MTGKPLAKPSKKATIGGLGEPKRTMNGWKSLQGWESHLTTSRMFHRVVRQLQPLHMAVAQKTGTKMEPREVETWTETRVTPPVSFLGTPIYIYILYTCVPCKHHPKSKLTSKAPNKYLHVRRLPKGHIATPAPDGTITEAVCPLWCSTHARQVHGWDFQVPRDFNLFARRWCPCLVKFPSSQRLYPTCPAWVELRGGLPTWAQDASPSCKAQPPGSGNDLTDSQKAEKRERTKKQRNPEKKRERKPKKRRNPGSW